jgi:putative endonuclease
LNDGRRQRGQNAESRAEDFLRRKGLRPIGRNYRCRLGELDLIMRDGDTVVIVEVRSRASGKFVDPRASVDAAKQRRLLRTTRHLLATRPELATRPIRFDVVAISGNDLSGTLAWIPGAFLAE